MSSLYLQKFWILLDVLNDEKYTFQSRLIIWVIQGRLKLKERYQKSVGRWFCS
jgi:hypothetical protein